MFRGSVLFAVLAVLLTGAQASDSTAVRLATFEYPPYVQQIDGQARGLAVELVREAFARMRRPVAIEFYPWSRSVKLIEADAIDGLFTIKKTPERMKRLNYPNRPLIHQGYVFFVRKDSRVRFRGDFADLAAATIGVVMSTSYGQRFDEAAARGAFARTVPASSYERIFRMLVGGRVDAVICSRLVGIEFVRRLGVDKLIEISGPPVETALSYLVFAPKNAALAPAFDKVITAMERDGTLDRIFARYAALPDKP